ncbi:FHA domain-containing protein [Anaeromyxobacter oryzae]|uniref:FHA domain-containing protein n=1 Tax=Anaeromyxobacter oryzae TaxID=2918170 RepID=A0ABN6MZ07_9BACT|nr:FHA domain-containing protein [Anaeromyxobacter oryzae]BDG06176.1 hypothetical protein AMOR_51720 [Anaeromyxobacter oryzae]
MFRSVAVHLPGRSPESVPLRGPSTAGGSRADGVILLGVPPAALRLAPCADGIVVEALVAGVRAAGSALAPGGRRLLRAGERVDVAGAGIEVPPGPDPEAASTRVEAAALLRAAAAGEPVVAGPHLVVLTGARAGARVPLAADQIIGRARGSGVRLADPLASRRHARLTLEPGGAALEDLGAKNGVSVNGVRLERRRARLAAGDEIAIGETLLALVLPGAARRAATGAPGEPGRADAVSAKRTARRRAGAAAPIGAAALLALSAAALALASW